MSGKGSTRRPMNISYTTYDTNWDEIFGEEKKPVNYRIHYKELTELNADGNEGRGRFGETVDIEEDDG